jgi:prepilin-type N-terminal cleavage/methylation domain-containing protein
MHKSGFTLFELLMVIAIISGLSLISLHFLSLSGTVPLRVEVERLRTHLLYLQKKAQLERKPQHLVFDVERRGYKTVQEWHAFSPGLSIAIKKELLGPPSHPDKPLIQAVTFFNKTVTCYADGTISAGAVYLTDSRAFYALTCDASELTCIRCYESDGKNWKLLHHI